MLEKDVIYTENLDKVKNLRNNTPNEDQFDNYNISKEVDGPFPHMTQQNRYNHWNDEGKNWGDFYCQQFQDERGKCVLLDIKRGNDVTNTRNKGKIVCKRQGDHFWEKDSAANWSIPSIVGDKKKFANHMYHVIKRNYNEKTSFSKDLFNTSLIKWVGNKMRFNVDEDLYEVKNCEDYSGILGINNYNIKEDKDGLWRNMFIGESKSGNFQIKTYNKSDFIDKNSEIRKYAEKYCEQAVYGYDEFNNPKKCTYSHANTDRGKKKLGKIFNKMFLKDGRHEEYRKRKNKDNEIRNVAYIKKDKFSLRERPFWMVHCKKPE